VTSLVAQIVCGDPGGAAAVAPVADLLRKDGNLDLRIALGRYATETFRRRGLQFRELVAVPTTEEARDDLGASGARVLLTGTSVGSQEPEKPYLAAARALGVPTIAVIDFWTAYRERFTDAAGTLRFVPDRLAVPDERARDEMVALGFPPAAIVVTGPPQYEDLVLAKTSFTTADRAKMRASIGAAPDDLVVLFASAPVAESYGERFGFTEYSVATLVVRILDELVSSRGRQIVLAMRAHPRERRAPPVVARRCRVVEASGSDAWRWILASDLVAGMFSALLVEACYLGMITISLMPGLRRPDPLPTNRTGLSLPVYREEGAYRMLERALLDNDLRREQFARLAATAPSTGATRRIADLVYELGGVSVDIHDR